MKLPTFITHYYEADYGPFLNICDLQPENVEKLVHAEKDAKTAFNRFSMGPDFLKWRREADDLLIRAYTEKFGRTPQGRPYFAVLGSFDKTLTMYRNGRKIVMEIDNFEEHELTFMYPDHAHLISFYGSDAPPLFYQPPADWEQQKFWGRLFTFRELCAEFSKLGIDSVIESHRARNRWAGCYVEAQIWRRHRTNDANTPVKGVSLRSRPHC